MFSFLFKSPGGHVIYRRNKECFKCIWARQMAMWYLVSRCMIWQLPIHLHTDGLYNDRLVSICARSHVTLDIGLHLVYVWAGVRWCWPNFLECTFEWGMFFIFAFKFRLVNENFSTVQKIIGLIFSLFPFDAIVVYPNANYWKKVHGGVLVYVLLSRLPTFCVFNVVVNHSIFVVTGLNPGVSSLSNESALQSTVIVNRLSLSVQGLTGHNYIPCIASTVF